MFDKEVPFSKTLFWVSIIHVRFLGCSRLMGSTTFIFNLVVWSVFSFCGWVDATSYIVLFTNCQEQMLIRDPNVQKRERGFLLAFRIDMSKALHFPTPIGAQPNALPIWTSAEQWIPSVHPREKWRCMLCKTNNTKQHVLSLYNLHIDRKVSGIFCRQNFLPQNQDLFDDHFLLCIPEF